MAIIYHISDLHIHEGKHEDILYAVKQLADIIHNDILQDNNNNNSTNNNSKISNKVSRIIVIAGDIFESKNKLSQFDLECFHSLLELLNMVQIIIVPGNHDCSVGKGRLDLITAALKNTSYKNVHLFTKTGVYNIAKVDIDFYIYSVIDDQLPVFTGNTSNNNNNRKNNNKKVAILHEPIKGCKLYGGITIDNHARFSTTDLTEYDLVILGDIHKYQLLRPNMAYSGSLIQKNKGEDEIHGFIKWTFSDIIPVTDNQNPQNIVIKSGLSHQFIRLKLNNAYTKVIARDNKIVKTIDMKFINNIKHLVFEHAGCSSEIIEEFRKKIIAKFGKIDETICRTKTIKTIEDGKDDNTEIKPLENNSELYKMLSDSLGEHPLHNDVVSLHKKLYSEISDELGHIKYKWRLKWISWSNLFCYGPDNYIDFTQLHRINSLIGKNKTGKSSIIDILLFVLYNRLLRGDRKSIINTTGKKYKVSCCFEILNQSCDTYIISREGDNLVGNQHQTVNLLMSSSKSDNNNNNNNNFVDSSWKNISSPDIVQTYTQLRNLIGCYDDLVNVNISIQDNISIVNKKTDDQVSEFRKYFGLDRLEKIENLVKDKYKITRSELKIIKSKVSNSPEKSKYKLDELDKKLIKVTAELKQAEIDRKTNAEIKHKYCSELYPDNILVYKNIVEIDKLISENETSSGKDKVNQEINKTQKNIEKLLETYQNFPKPNSCPSSNLSVSQLPLISLTLNAKNSELSKINDKITEKTSKIIYVSSDDIELHDKYSSISISTPKLNNQNMIISSINELKLKRNIVIDKLQKITKKSEFSREIIEKTEIKQNESELRAIIYPVQQHDRLPPKLFNITDATIQKKILEDKLVENEFIKKTFDHPNDNLKNQKKTLENIFIEYESVRKTLENKKKIEPFSVTMSKNQKKILEDKLIEDEMIIKKSFDTKIFEKNEEKKKIQKSEMLNSGTDQKLGFPSKLNELKYNPSCQCCQDNKLIVKTSETNKINDEIKTKLSNIDREIQDLIDNSDKEIKAKHVYILEEIKKITSHISEITREYIENIDKEMLSLAEKSDNICKDITKINRDIIQEDNINRENISKNQTETDEIRWKLDKLNDDILSYRVDKKKQHNLEIQKKIDILNDQKYYIDLDNRAELSIIDKDIQSLEHALETDRINQKIAENYSKYHDIIVKNRKLNDEILSLNVRKTDLEAEIKQMEIEKKYISDMDDYEKNVKIMEKINQLRIQNHELEIVIKKINLLEQLKINRIYCSHNDELNIKIQEVQIKIDKLDSLIKKYNDQTGKIHVFRVQTIEYNKSLDEILKLERAEQIYDKYLDCINMKDGIPYQLLKKSCSNIEMGMNNILSDITNFRITLGFDLKKFKIMLVDTKNKQKNIPAEQGSGFQKFIIDLSMRICLAKNHPYLPNFLIVDEGFGCMDKEHLSNTKDFLAGLNNKKYFDWIILISHIEELQYITKQNITIEQEDDSGVMKSTVKVGEQHSVPTSTLAISDVVKEEVMIDNEDGYYCQACQKQFKKRVGGKEKHEGTKIHSTNLLKRQQSLSFAKIDKMIDNESDHGEL